MPAASLNKPYPFSDNIKKIISGNLLIGAFVAFFLIVFQPFDINRWITPNKLFKLAGFGIISFVVPTLVSLLSLKAVSQKRKDAWTTGNEITIVLFVLLLIALGNLLYGRWIGIMPLTLKGYVFALGMTLVIGIFPVTYHISRKHKRMLQQNLENAVSLTRTFENSSATPKAEVNTGSDELLNFVAENNKDRFTIKSAQLFFIESADNYSNIVYTDQNVRKKQILRGSLKRLEGQINSARIVRCHRTYIVNLDKVSKVEGNAAGYKLFLAGTDDVIPVSRNYIPAVNAILQK